VKTEVIDPESSTAESASIRPVAVVLDTSETVRDQPELSDTRRLYVVRQTFNQHSIGESVYLEPGDAVPLVAIALVEEVAHGPNPAGA
jgi:hypothetical protein